MSEEQIKTEYERLLANESVQQVVSHGQFYDNFWGLLTNIHGDYYKNAKIEVIPGNKIRISREGFYPEAINGIYKGVGNYDNIIISIEQINGESHLVFSSESAEIMRNPQDLQYDFGYCSRRVQIFNDLMKVAEGNISSSSNIMKNTSPQSQLYFIPELSLISVANGALAPIDYNRYTRYTYDVYNRLNYMPGVCHRTQQIYDRNVGRKNYECYYSIGRECPSGMRVEGAPIASSEMIEEIGKPVVKKPMTTLGQYKDMTLSDALNQVNEYYSNVPYKRF